MSKAIVDPAELRRFAQELRRFNTELEGQMGVLATRLAGLGQSWRDQENVKFVEQFEQTMKVLGRFVEASNQQIPFLMRKADRIEDYLRQR